MKIQLKRLSLLNRSPDYLQWLNDSDISKYLEVRFNIETSESLDKYISDISDPSSGSHLLGIFDQISNKHIGNVKIGPVNPHHDHADLGLLIGDKSYWGKGIGTEAIHQASFYAFNCLGLNTLKAGCYASNIGSERAFLKNNWSKVGCIPSYWRCGSTRDDEILFSLQRRDYPFYSPRKSILLVGQSPLMHLFADYLTSLGSYVHILVAPRQSSADLDNIHVMKHNLTVVDNPLDFARLSEFSTCYCFGPAWILPREFIDNFNGSIYNYNGIPIPSYLGGAHYTWQILNNDFSGASVIQQITDKVDRGPVHHSISYAIDNSNSPYTPSYYDLINTQYGLIALKEHYFYKFISSQYFDLNPISPDWTNKRYYPRLLTHLNGWIDWSLDLSEIIRFIHAFSSPYSGAKTFYDGRVINLMSISFQTFDGIHSYCSGLIVARDLLASSFTVAVRNGYLIITGFSSDHIVLDDIKVGSRLYTPESKLIESKDSVLLDQYGKIDE